MDKMRKVSPHSMEGETGWQMRHNYNSCMKMLENYQTQIVTEWQSNITAELTIKLKQPLLVRLVKIINYLMKREIIRSRHIQINTTNMNDTSELFSTLQSYIRFNTDDWNLCSG